MEIKKENISTTKVKLTVDMTASELKPHMDKVYKSLVKDLKVPGFRPGKAPQFVVEREIGQDKFYQEVLEEVMPDAYYKAITQENLISVDRPEIKVLKYAPTSGLTFEAEVSVLPEIILPDYKSIKVKRAQVNATEKDTLATLEELSHRYATFTEVKRKVKKGDRTEIDFEGTKDGRAFEGGSSKNHPLIVGEGMFIPGFEENLIGMEHGEEKSFDITFPNDYHEKSLAGEKVNFKVKMVTISEKIPATIDDNFAKSMGGFKSLTDLKKDISTNLQKSKEAEEERRLEEEIMTKIAEKVKIEIPETLTHQEIHKMMEEINHNLGKSQVTLEKYLEMTGKTKNQLEEELKPDAEKRVKLGLVLSKIAEVEKIDVSKEDIEAEKARILASSGEHRAEYEKQFENHEVIHGIENQIIARKTIEKIFSYCLK